MRIPKYISAIVLLLLTGLGCSNTPANFWTIRKDNSYWFQSPGNSSEFMLMVQNVQPTQPARVGQPYKSRYAIDGPQIWASKTSEQIKKMGFKGVGAWCDPTIDQYLPFCKDLNVLLNCHIPISSPLWPKEVDRIISQETEGVKENHNLIGYYLDNELDWEHLQPYAHEYFSVICTSVRRHDPNHLILGVRFNCPPPISVLRASRGFVDAHSFNIYSSNITSLPKEFEEAHAICQVPIILSEFSFYATNNSSNDSNSMGFGGMVNNQKERADHYFQEVMAMAKIPYVIGADFFQFNDEPAGGRVSDGENCNFGIVDINDEPYPDMIAMIQKLSGVVNSVHSAAK